MADVIGKKVFEVEVDARKTVSGFKEVEQAAGKTATKTKSSFQDARGAFVGLGNDLTGGLASKLMDAYEASGAFVKGMGAIKGAIIATGIGALIVAIGLLVQNWSEVSEVLGGVNPKTKELAKVTRDAAAASREASDAFGLEERRLRALGVAESDIAKQKADTLSKEQKDLDAAVEATKARINSLKGAGGVLIGGFTLGGGPDEEKIAEEEQILKDQLNRAKEVGVQLLEIEAASFKAINEEVDASLKEREKIEEEGKKAAIEKAKERAAERERIAKEEAERLDKIRDDREAKNKEFEQAKFEEELAAEEARRQLAEGIAKANEEIFLSEKDKEINAVRDKYAELFELAKQDAEARKELTFLQGAEIAAINSKFLEEQTAKAAEEKEKQQEQEKNAQAARIALTANGLSALTSLTEIFEGKSREGQRRAFKVNKGLRIAQTLITTYQNATAAYASQLAIPSPDAPVRAGIAAGFAVAQGLAQVAAIQKTKFDEGGGGSPSASGGGSPSFGSAPSESTPVNPTQNAQVGNQQTPQPIQAYLLPGLWFLV